MGSGCEPGCEATSATLRTSRRSLAVGCRSKRARTLLCQVEGCDTDLSKLRKYHKRYKICDVHQLAESILVGGVRSRFCQQCGRFQRAIDFDGVNRSCRLSLFRHNERRKGRRPFRPSTAEVDSPHANNHAGVTYDDTPEAEGSDCPVSDSETQRDNNMHVAYDDDQTLQAVEDVGDDGQAMSSANDFAAEDISEYSTGHDVDMDQLERPSVSSVDSPSGPEPEAILPAEPSSELRKPLQHPEVEQLQEILELLLCAPSFDLRIALLFMKDVRVCTEQSLSSNQWYRSRQGKCTSGRSRGVDDHAQPSPVDVKQIADGRERAYWDHPVKRQAGQGSAKVSSCCDGQESSTSFCRTRHSDGTVCSESWTVGQQSGHNTPKSAPDKPLTGFLSKLLHCCDDSENETGVFVADVEQMHGIHKSTRHWVKVEDTR